MKNKHSQTTPDQDQVWQQMLATQQVMMQLFIKNMEYMMMLGLNDHRPLHQEKAERVHAGTDWMVHAAEEVSKTLQTMLNAYVSQVFELGRWAGSCSEANAKMTGLKGI